MILFSKFPLTVHWKVLNNMWYHDLLSGYRCLMNIIVFPVSEDKALDTSEEQVILLQSENRTSSTESTCASWAADLCSGWLDYPKGEFILNQDMLSAVCWASSEPQKRNKCELPVVFLRDNSTYRRGYPLNLFRNIPGRKPCGGSLSHWRHALFLFSTESVRTMTCRCLLTSSAGFGHKKLAQTWKQQQIHSEGNGDVFSQDSTTTYIIFSMSRELNWS